MNEQELRQVFETQIREHILGPGLAKEIICCKEDASDEILDDDPKELYTTGVLYPQFSQADGTNQNNDNEPTSESEEDDDENIILDDDDDSSNSDNEEEEKTLDTDKEQQVPDDRNRSACSDHIGLITCIDNECKEVKISLKYAKYRRLSKEEHKKVKIKLGYNFHLLDDLLKKYDEIEGNRKADEYIDIDKEEKTISLKVTDYKPEYPKIEGELVELNYVFKKLFSQKFYQREEKTEEYTIECENPQPIVGDDFVISFNYYLRENRNGSNKKYLKVLVRNTKKYNGEKVENAPTELCLFQTCAHITPVSSKLITYTDPVSYVFDDENNETEYIYRNVKNFGKGIGCAVSWEENGYWIETAYIPSSEVKSFSNELNQDYCEKLGLEVNPLNEACKLINLSHWHKDDTDYIARLEQFVEGYGKWVEKQKADAASESQFKTIYDDILARQDKLLERLRNNIKYLKENETALECFQLANTAMLIQMTIARNPHFAKNRDIGNITENAGILNNLVWFHENEENAEKPASYRPFQLAFLLMNVRSTFEEDDEYRKDYVDLIWFPTGGGKTEAYLALTALTIIARRKTARSDEEANGVSVIMRYTLRLLTTQQFERASYLICALEFMRNHIDLGRGERITIGRWIGQEAGNKRQKYIQGLQVGNKDKTNPFPVTYCPWCGGKLVRDIKEEDDTYKYGYIKDGQTDCLNDNCHFHKAYLPIQYVDKELYHTPPTLLLATVDKFANLTKLDAAKMLGIETGAKSPDLIIQDELHLISGPLGSMVGFFEMIVEEMCSKNGHRPKIIASTATTRNTGDQINKLYNKEVNVFPAQGITYNDNFFSHVEEDSKRRHIGICPQAFPVKAEIRIIAQLILAKISLLKKYLISKGIDITNAEEVSNAVLEDSNHLCKEVDPYWSLILYYNSLKDLGRTRSRVSQEIFENIRTQKRYLQIPTTLDFVWSGIDKRVQEFTSRMDSSQIKDMLTKAESRAGLKKNQETNLLHEDSENLDLVLASNMISVGIDVARWNVMLMSGQPRSNSEYIQSSSRVARNHMGLVVNIYSPQRIREVSMFENFTSYHEAYYKYVEPLSLTPVTMQILKENIVNNVIKCYREYIYHGKKDRDVIANSLKDELIIRFHIDAEMAEFAKNEISQKWEADDFATSLRDVDPDCWTIIKDINYK